MKSFKAILIVGFCSLSANAFSYEVTHSPGATVKIIKPPVIEEGVITPEVKKIAKQFKSQATSLLLEKR